MDIVEFLNSPTEAHMDLVTVMMQTEKFSQLPPEAPPPIIEFCSSGGPPPTYFNSPPATTSPTLISPSTTLSFCGAAIRDPAVVSPSFSNSSAGRTSTSAADQLSCNDDRPDHPLGHCSRRRPSMGAMRETIFQIAAMQPIHVDPESVRPPKRRNVKISTDPQSVAARHRRERISERIRMLQRLVPGGTKMDTASMLDEAIHYLKFLKTQVQSLERRAAANYQSVGLGLVSPAAGISSGSYSCFGKVLYCPPDQLFYY